MAVLMFRGRRACPCQVDALPLFEKHAGGGRRDTYYQLIGGATQSAGTHATGGCDDTPSKSDAYTKRSRSMGGWGSNRTRRQGFAMDHHHRNILGCPHMSAGARFQESEYRAGRNGLAGRGRDTQPRPAKIITFAQWRRSVIEKANADNRIVIGGKTYKPLTSVSAKWINRATSRGVSRNVYWLQVWLRRTGFYLGTLDGKKGPMTLAAVARQRKAWGWGPNKHVTFEFLSKLRTQARSQLKVAK